jgi:hypothetical protein
VLVVFTVYQVTILSLYLPLTKVTISILLKQKTCCHVRGAGERPGHGLAYIFFFPSNVARCAGPEDLVTAERIWAETKDGDYSGAYKEQMSIFMGEIREFFNAGGLEDKLNDLKSKGLPSSEGIALIDTFLGAKVLFICSQKLLLIGSLHCKGTRLYTSALYRYLRSDFEHSSGSPNSL